MQMSNFQHSVLEFCGEVATTYPRTWIYSFAFAGIALGLLIYGGLGLWLGGLFAHPTTGMYLGLTWYGYWFITQVDALKTLADEKIKLLEEYAAMLR